MRPVEAAMAEMATDCGAGRERAVTDFHPDALRRGWKRTFQRGGETIEMESEPYSMRVELATARICELEGSRSGFLKPRAGLFDEMPERAILSELPGQGIRPCSRGARVAGAEFL